MQSPKINFNYSTKRKIFYRIFIIFIIFYTLLYIPIFYDKISTQEATQNKFEEDYVNERLKRSQNTPTLINGSSFFFRKEITAYVMEAVNFTFYYTDAILNISVVYLDNQTYAWQKYDNQGFVIEENNGTLITTAENSFILDIGTEDLTMGNYLILAYFYKIGYEPKSAIIDLKIELRPTLINNTYYLETVKNIIFVGESINFSFSYKDFLTNTTIHNIDFNYFYWSKYDQEGFIIDGGQEELIFNANDLYIIDFSTETRVQGNYSIIADFKKENYTTKSIEILLTINPRTFQYQLSDNIKNNHISVKNGKIVRIELNLLDTSRGFIPMDNASIILIIVGEIYEFTEISPGLYRFDFNTNQFNSFFEPLTLEGIIEISKDGFDSEVIKIEITVEMEQLFPGFPTLHFLNIMGVIIVGLISIFFYKKIRKKNIQRV